MCERDCMRMKDRFLMVVGWWLVGERVDGGGESEWLDEERMVG